MVGCPLGHGLSRAAGARTRPPSPSVRPLAARACRSRGRHVCCAASEGREGRARWYSPERWLVALANALEGGYDLSPAENELPVQKRPVVPPGIGNQLILAGGCFWCLQPALDGIEGVLETTCGYTGGVITSPSYGQVQSRKSGHVECVLVTFASPDQEGLAELTREVMRRFVAAIDPTDDSGQGNNRGPQYRPAAFWHTQLQKEIIEEVLGQEAERRGKREKGLAVRVRKSTPFWTAEDVHQHYYRRNGIDPEPETPYWMGAFLD